MNMASMPVGSSAINPAGMFLMDLSSGTAVNPRGWRMPMLMKPFGSWNTMFMAEAFIVDTQQSGPRGGDKLYSPNWFMASAQHRVGATGAFQMELMLSLDAATMTNRSYPLLFQTGETAFGKPLVDAQHPHDFIMSLGFHYTRALNENTILDLYFAPAGDPALGPVAYPHRASAMELPQATLSHHWQDSTHIANEVVTAGLEFHKKIKIEASGFYGSEPNENRWNIDSGPINSWSARIWYFPTKNWAAQISAGRLAKPEELQPGDQFRSTASVHYTRGNWSSSIVWGRDHSTETRRNTDAYLAETVVPLGTKNFLTGRAESVDKDELFSGQAAFEGRAFRIGAYTVGYTRDLDVLPFLQTGLGVNIETYSLPAAIKPSYGDHPLGGNVFLRFRLKPREAAAMPAMPNMTQAVTGLITDTMCGSRHTMLMGKSDESCIAMCLKGASEYALFDGSSIWKLSGRNSAARFAAQKVTVTGTADHRNRIIHVLSIQPVTE